MNSELKFSVDIIIHITYQYCIFKIFIENKIKIKFDLLIFMNGLNNVTKFQNNSWTIEENLKQTTTNTYSMIKKLNNMLFEKIFHRYNFNFNK